ncbi:uncharacterized protein LOC123408121 [Hordeum vulgare subsp. vulgare]|uniref:uncharacterized protein LOC123408121 n=1 Tax=Hordeum vulgare subsp. vulgare TaxID=112509 RepID=UPI001D1A3DAB|nr:uncharacterized protein LOC123408121 [Hordeum vulgare subsp. vulgare]
MPPPAKCATTVLDLDDDLLREVFLHLPGLPSLVRAALSCTTFLRAVRSSPAFRRSFRALHPSPFAGLFVQRLGFKPEPSSFHAHHSRPDPDFEAAVRGADFSLTGLPIPDAAADEDGDEEEEEDDEDENSEEEEEEDASPVWEIERCCDRYVLLFNRRAKQIAAYNPLTRALHLYPPPPRLFTDATNFEFHIISSQEDPRVPPACCVSLSTSFRPRRSSASSRRTPASRPSAGGSLALGPESPARWSMGRLLDARVETLHHRARHRDAQFQ